MRLLEAEPAVLARWRRRARTCSSTRSRTSIGASSGSPCSSRRRPTGSSSSVTTTSRSTAGGWPTCGACSSSPAALPGLRRVDLVTNYRCPAPVVARAVRLVERNANGSPRSSGPDRARPAACSSPRTAPTRSCGSSGSSTPGRTTAGRGPSSPGRTASSCRPSSSRSSAASRSAPTGSRPRSTTRASTPSWPRRRRRTRACPSWSGWAVLVDAARATDEAERPTTRRSPAGSSPPRCSPGPRPTATSSCVHRPPSSSGATCSPDSGRTMRALSLATAHATKGLEFDHVAVLGMEAGRFPSARSIGDAEDPARALEEERRLAYVAWTRARRTLTLSFDPEVASPFLARGVRPRRARHCHPRARRSSARRSGGAPPRRTARAA